MKKLILMLFVSALTLASCEKDEELITPQNTSNCTCGTIVNDEITNCYTLSIRNECSGVVKRFCFDQQVWFNNYVGDYVCVSNVQPW